MKFKYCPECGKKLIAKEAGDDGLVPWCEKCEQYYFDMFPSCVIVLVYNESNEMVLIQQDYLSKDYFGYVAGYMKPGETAEESALREVEEELGFRLDDLEYAGTYWFGKGGQLMHGFMGKALSKDFVLSDEVNRAVWVQPDKAVEYMFPDRPGNAIHPMLKKFQEKIQKTKMEDQAEV